MNPAGRLALLLEEAGSLVSAAARDRLTVAYATLAGTDGELAIECHLSASTDQGRVDLVARVHPADRDRLLARTDGGVSKSLRAFLERWATPGDSLERLPFVELEFDLGRDRDDHGLDHAGGEVTPWIGPANEPLVRQGVAAIAASKRGLPVDAWASYQLAIAVVEALGLPSASWRDRIHACFAALPPSGCVNHLTVLDARPGAGNSGVRMIASLPRFEVTRYLRAVGFSGRVEHVHELLDRYAPHQGQVDLDVDLRIDDASDRIGIYSEFIAPRVRNSSLRSRLEALAEDGLVSPATLTELQRWIEHVDGRLSRALTFKIGRAATRRRGAADAAHQDEKSQRLFAKVYLQSLGSVE